METTTPTKPAKIVKEKPQYATAEQFTELMGVLKTLAEDVVKLKNAPGTPEAKESEEIRKAKFDQAPINPAWEEKAREIIGEAVDHCEVFYPKQGGQLFTVVIKDEFSNAPKEYLERMKSDRRTREIGNEGISGVELWCKLIRQNLKRTLYYK